MNLKQQVWNVTEIHKFWIGQRDWKVTCYYETIHTQNHVTNDRSQISIDNAIIIRKEMEIKKKREREDGTICSDRCFDSLFSKWWFEMTNKELLFFIDVWSVIMNFSLKLSFSSSYVSSFTIYTIDFIHLILSHCENPSRKSITFPILINSSSILGIVKVIWRYINI